MTRASRALRFAAIGALGVAAGLLYRGILFDLARLWLENDDYSHAWAVLAAIAYLVWARRDQLPRTSLQPSLGGLWIVLASLALLLIGTAGVEFYLMRISVIGLIAGVIVFLAGWRWLKVWLFPLGLAVLVVPVPPVLFYQAAFPLQLYASKFGVTVLELFGIPVLREGNIIALAHTTLEVNEACSGIRSLLSLFALAVLDGYFVHTHVLPRVIVVMASIPIAVVCNGLRVAGTGIAAHYGGPAAATGFFHGFSGWALFMTALAMLVVISRALKMMPVLVREPDLLPQ